MGSRLSIDPRQSTRGLIEPTLALLPDGRILMVMRGSNGGSKDRECQIPGYKWHCTSSDGGRTWSEVQPFCYSNGEPFHSPSSISQLFQHSSGKYFWLGNICPDNPKDNGPRFPLIIAEVEPSTCTLKKETTLEIDTLQPDDHPSLSLSNFSAHEDRENGDILIHLTRMFSKSANFEGDAYLYRVGI